MLLRLMAPRRKTPFTAVLGHFHTNFPLQRAVYHTMAQFWQGLCSFATGLQSSGVVLMGALLMVCCCKAPAKARTRSTATHDLQRTGVVQRGFLGEVLLKSTSHCASVLLRFKSTFAVHTGEQLLTHLCPAACK